MIGNIIFFWRLMYLNWDSKGNRGAYLRYVLGDKTKAFKRLDASSTPQVDFFRLVKLALLRGGVGH